MLVICNLFIQLQLKSVDFLHPEFIEVSLQLTFFKIFYFLCLNQKRIQSLAESTFVSAS